MKLWFVLYIFGKVGGSWGPLPYDLAECHARMAEKVAELDEGFAKHSVPKTVDGKVVKRENITVACIEQEDRPVLEDFVVEGESPEILKDAQ